MRYFTIIIAVTLALTPMLVKQAYAGASDGWEVFGGDVTNDDSQNQNTTQNNPQDVQTEKPDNQQNVENEPTASIPNKDEVNNSQQDEEITDIVSTPNLNDQGKISIPEADMMMDCVATPSLAQDHMHFDAIKKSGNLIRKPGSARRAQGQYIQLTGKVVDEDCVPISNAVIQIWQTDSKGKYAESYKLNTVWDVIDKDFDKNFAYSGTAQSNNTGEYSFLTILPVSNEDDIAPHINVTVKHPDFEEVSTMIYFNKHPKNANDKNLQTLDDFAGNLLIANGKKLDPTGNLEGREYNFTITLRGVNKYRRY